MKLPNFDFDSGAILLIDKPLHWTSFDVVKKLKYALKIKKIGHAGTLDPLASGLLILCTGKMTKMIDQFQQKEKEYTGILSLGKTTPSIDLETEFNQVNDITHLNENIIKAAIKEFIGEIKQVPPQYSAIKVQGERVYKKARKGIQVNLNPRLVEIKQFEILALDLPDVHFRIVCSKGTYIRSLVRDVGEKLKCGAYLKKLTRTRIGEHQLSEAYRLEDLVQINWANKQLMKK